MSSLESKVTLSNNQKFCKTFGWKPTVKLEDWIDGQK